MKEVLLIAIGSAIVNNVVLSQFLGLCPFFGVSKKVNTAAGMGAAVIFVITIASFITSVLDKIILQQFDITYLRTIVFIWLKHLNIASNHNFIGQQPPIQAENSFGLIIKKVVLNEWQKHMVKQVLLPKQKSLLDQYLKNKGMENNNDYN